MEERPNRQKKSGFALDNRTLLILVGILSAVLVVLLVICGTVIHKDPADSQSDPILNSNSAGGSSSAHNSSSAAPNSSAVTTQPGSSVTTQPPVTSAPPATSKPPVTPEGGDYINVGYGYIAEVIQPDVETFDGGKTDDYSHPTNNYLPEGTVDYCAKDIVYGSSMKYVQLRSGHRVYYDKKVYPFETGGYYHMIKEVKQYEGWLPDHNEIGVVSLQTVGRHSILTLDCLWKAPFYFDNNQTGYANPKSAKDRDYAVVSNNITYVDITFCYATVFTGNVSIPAGHPLFKSAEIIKNEADYTLRLHLRKAGGFYGWHAYYNDNDQLCFQFLNPAKVTAADNKYGADLTGTLVMLDVGHGGLDGGAAVALCPTCNVEMMASDLKSGRCPTCKTKAETVCDEAELNMALANALKAELESIGATVVLNRTDDSIITVNDRQAQMLEISPDICIAIHQNSNNSESVRGFFSMYYTPWSQMLANYIRENTKQTGVYTRNILQWSAAYFMCRQPVCPTVLTENGFMSNEKDLVDMRDPAKVEIKAAAIAQSVADYFLAINK